MNNKDKKQEEGPEFNNESGEQNDEKEQIVEVEQNEEAKKIAELEAQVADLNDKYIRLYSEFDNYRKRTVKERIEQSKTAGEEVIKNLLAVLDDFERALKFNQQTEDIVAVKEGIKLIYDKFKNTLTQKGLEEMPSLGKEFDTDLHEAITKVPAPKEEMKGKVVDELEKGYALNGKVIRFAKVVVGS